MSTTERFARIHNVSSHEGPMRRGGNLSHSSRGIACRPRTRTAAPRGVTLIEMLVVVAILGVIAALATPSLLPLARRGKLKAATEEVAAFLDDARARASSQGRCFRVRVVAGSLVLERRSSVDCVNLAADGWEAPTRTKGLAGVTLTVESIPAALAADERLIFRPNSRLRGDGTRTATTFGSRIVVDPGGGQPERGVVVVTRHGRVCAAMMLSPPVALTAPVSCP